jgi:RNA polymerase sigma factor (sigma-70 family)
MSDSGSVSEWLSSLKQGSEAAAQKIWERYYARLIHDANLRMGKRPRRAVDEEDVVQEAFASFFRAVEEGRFPQLRDRDDLWAVLFMLMQRRTNDHFREELAGKRGGGKVRGDSALSAVEQPQADVAGFEQLADRVVAPESVDDLINLLRDGFDTFQDDMFRAIAVSKLQGYGNQEIAALHGISLRAVERKLQLIRRMMLQQEE